MFFDLILFSTFTVLKIFERFISYRYITTAESYWRRKLYYLSFRGCFSNHSLYLETYGFNFIHL